jgi:hypothetical protein
MAGDKHIPNVMGRTIVQKRVENNIIVLELEMEI